MKKYMSLSLITLAILGLASCGNTSSSTSSNVSKTTTTEETTIIEDKDTDGEVTFNDVSATGYAASYTQTTIDTSLLGVDTTLTTPEKVTSTSDKTLSGTYTNGIDITMSKGSTVSLTLNNATVYAYSSDSTSDFYGRALFSENKITLNLIIPEGTTSYIYTNIDDANALHIKGDLNISGGGKLVIASLTKNAVKVSKDLTIENTSLEVYAGGNGFNVSSLTATSSTIDVKYAEKDAIHAEREIDPLAASETAEFDVDKGSVTLVDSKVTTYSNGDSIQSNGNINISGGETNLYGIGNFVIYSETNKTLYDLDDTDFFYSYDSNQYQHVDLEDTDARDGYYALIQSNVGLKVVPQTYTYESDTETEYDLESTEYNVTITDEALVNIFTADGGIEVEYGYVLIEGGTTTIDTAGSAVEAEYEFKITGDDAILDITNSWDGISSAMITFNGGTTNISVLDDAIKAKSSVDSYDELVGVYIKKGALNINSEGTYAIQSNQAITITGGTTTVLASNLFDVSQSVVLKGGVLLALTDNESSTLISTASTISYLDSNTTISNGDTVTVIDSSNVEYITAKSIRDSSYLFYSSSLSSSNYTVKIS